MQRVEVAQLHAEHGEVRAERAVDHRHVEQREDERAAAAAAQVAEEVEERRRVQVERPAGEDDRALAEDDQHRDAEAQHGERAEGERRVLGQHRAREQVIIRRLRRGRPALLARRRHAPAALRAVARGLRARLARLLVAHAAQDVVLVHAARDLLVGDRLLEARVQLDEALVRDRRDLRLPRRRRRRRRLLGRKARRWFLLGQKARRWLVRGGRAALPRLRAQRQARRAKRGGSSEEGQARRAKPGTRAPPQPPPIGRHAASSLPPHGPRGHALRRRAGLRSGLRAGVCVCGSATFGSVAAPGWGRSAGAPTRGSSAGQKGGHVHGTHTAHAHARVHAGLMRTARARRHAPWSTG